MSYTKHTWVNNETITATKMNNIEDGIEEAAQSGGSSAVIIIDDGTALDKTYAEIYDLVESGTPCYVSYTGEKAITDLDSSYQYHVDLMPIVKVYKYNSDYRIACAFASGAADANIYNLQGPATLIYSATNASAYPSFIRVVYVNSSALNTTEYRF